MANSSYFYPRPPRGGRRYPDRPSLAFPFISIHALREEGDSKRLRTGNRQQAFLSTPSARRATRASAVLPHFRLISIHALREEGDCVCGVYTALVAISIHALREEGDAHTRKETIIQKIFLSTPSARRATHSNQKTIDNNKFLSTPSARRATKKSHRKTKKGGISIHALREEGDIGISRNQSSVK